MKPEDFIMAIVNNIYEHVFLFTWYMSMCDLFCHVNKIFHKLKICLIVRGFSYL